MKIYLIGMPGSGKSVIGNQLALHFNLPFVDLDTVIEEAEGMTVQEIFRSYGEEYFRQKEAEQLRNHAGSETGFVMATGGGAPCFHKGMEIIHATGISVYLNVSLTELVRRNRNNAARPLLQQGDIHEKLSALLAIREPVYRQATFILSGNQIQVKDVIALLKS